MHHFQVIFFRGRMKMEELPECEDTVGASSQISGENTGKNRTRGEYLPGFQAYYEKLKEDEGIEYLLLGQHFYELAPGEYSFSKKD